MVISGSVSKNVKNELIDQWQWAWNVYQSLLKWKTDVFDKKVARELQMLSLKAKLVSDTKTIMKLS